MFRDDTTHRSQNRNALKKFKTDHYTASLPPVEKEPSWKSWCQIYQVCFTAQFPLRKLDFVVYPYSDYQGEAISCNIAILQMNKQIEMKINIF